VPRQRQLRLLLSSAGRRVELMNCFRADAARLGIGLEVLAVDSVPSLSAACHVADRAFAVPPTDAVGFVDCLLSICREQGVDLLVPTIDPELELLSRVAPEFVAEAGTRVAISAPDVVALARDKLRTAEHLAAHGLPVPWTTDAARLAGQAPLQPFRPLILKPRGGSSSHGLRRVERAEDWPPRTADRDIPMAGYVAQSLLEGEEYTVNLFFDTEGRLRAAVPHRRLAVRGGEVAKGVTRRLPRLLELATALGSTLPGARGALCFQALVQPSGEAAIIELNARFGGGFPLAYRAGARFSQWLLEEALELPSTANNDEWRDGVLMLRYDAAVFVDE
jgi:carbamoyl-phosphate synthase large subunit